VTLLLGVAQRCSRYLLQQPAALHLQQYVARHQKQWQHAHSNSGEFVAVAAALGVCCSGSIRGGLLQWMLLLLLCALLCRACLQGHGCVQTGVACFGNGWFLGGELRSGFVEV
jgi:hypothetical protein